MQFPARRRVVKTYGRKSTVAAAGSASAPAASRRQRSLLLRQQTLTQLDYVTQTSSLEDSEEGLLRSSSSEKNEMEAKDGREKDSRNKRRKTLGDAPSSSSFRTQTLTQLLSGESLAGSGVGGEGGDGLMIKDSDEEEEEEEEDGGGTGGENGRAASLVPETPSHQKIRVNLDEVPSSQPTPFTPMLERYSPGTGRSPLISRSTNVDAPPPTLETISKRPRTLVIQDTFSPSRSPLSSTPSESFRQETPTKRPRRQPLAEIPVGSLELGREPASASGGDPTPSNKENRKRAFVEIPDSDDELDALSPSPLKAASIRRASQRSSRSNGPAGISPLAKTAPNPAISDDMTSSDLDGPGTPTPLTRKAQVELPPHNPQAAAPEEPEPEAEPGPPQEPASSDHEAPGTPTPQPRRVQIELPPQSSPSVFEETPQKPRKKASPVAPRSVRRETQRNTQRNAQRNTQRNTQRNLLARSQFYSQGLESQRVPLDIVRSLGPLTDRTDIVISIHPDAVEAIVSGTKDHEFRTYKLPIQVTRCWIYTTLPVGEVKYMATLGPAQEPGEIDSETGVGNAEFNSGTSGFSYAHKLKQVYQLNNPVPLALLKKKGLGDAPPQKWRYLPPGIVGQLLGNLRCALFAEGDEEYDDEELDDLLWEEEEEESDDKTGDGGADVTISQELEEQIRSDFIQSTQMHSSDAHEIVPASSRVDRSATPTKEASGEEVALPALPSTTTRTSSRLRNQSQRREHLQKTPLTARRVGFVPPSQATTASQASSPAVSPERSSVPRPITESIELLSSENFGEDETPIRLPSGLLTGSSQVAMMDSLLVDEMRQPPEILDSDDDDDNDDD